jgi:hypothetical protein
VHVPEFRAASKHNNLRWDDVVVMNPFRSYHESFLKPYNCESAQLDGILRTTAASPACAALTQRSRARHVHPQGLLTAPLPSPPLHHRLHHRLLRHRQKPR